MNLSRLPTSTLAENSAALSVFLSQHARHRCDVFYAGLRYLDAFDIELERRWLELQLPARIEPDGQVAADFGLWAGFLAAERIGATHER